MSDQESLVAPSRRGPAPAADAAPPARRRRSTWRDPRMAGGLVLIGAAVALGAWAVSTAADTQQVYVLARDVAPSISVKQWERDLHMILLDILDCQKEIRKVAVDRKSVV